MNGEYFKIKFVSIWCCEKEHNDVKNDKIVHGTEKLKPAPNEEESCREFKLLLSLGPKLSCVLGDSQTLSSNLNR